MTDPELDAALARWARAPLGDAERVERIVRRAEGLAASPPAGRWPRAARWALPTAAAFVAMAIPILAPTSPPQTPEAEEASFLLLHAPTPIEELSL
ncbi:MAG: hypothetical protein NZM40_02535 [Sphingomonadaceae bacterium]|uniref:hypothetical protein n=1 Tax=Thermaurantiacus sp. TaxID=2820283 RepID=UPI00298EFFBE|nr:hypothetical protein [Thermaurantiacus sp.]MCS6986302.1 hypothetical protein [Sphingomonadaceae bacterium]MDW8415751.1 hypothetical protein [Thermaurantiacus sp.]